MDPEQVLAIVLARDEGLDRPRAAQGLAAALEVGEQALGALVAVLGVLREQLEHDAGDGLGDRRVDAGRRRGREGEVRVDELHRVQGLEGALTREHLVKDDAERVEVRPVVDAAVHAACLLGGDVRQHVGDHRRRVEPLVRAGDLGVDAEARDLDRAARADEHVVRAQIAVDEPRRVHRGEAFGERGREIERLADRHSARRARGEDPREIAAREVLENDDQGAGELLDAAQRDEAGRGEAARCARTGA